MQVHNLSIYANYINLIAYAVDYIHLFSLAIQYLQAFQGTFTVEVKTKLT